jgi:DeoR/GlpR family transcriptional regulator of sugar metabolism
MAKVKRYLSKRWLKRRLYQDNMTVEEVAEECGVSHMTIRRAAEKHGLRV